MDIEREEKRWSIETAEGTITIIEVLRVYRDLSRRQMGIYRKDRESSRFEADGEWFTPEMARELAEMLYAYGPRPKWLPS